MAPDFDHLKLRRQESVWLGSMPGENPSLRLKSGFAQDDAVEMRRENQMVGARGFEPRTPCAQGRCATRLRYAPT